MTLYRIYEFFFNRWKKEIYQEGIKEIWSSYCALIGEIPNSEFIEVYDLYKYTNKFDGSTKLVKKYR